MSQTKVINIGNSAINQSINQTTNQSIDQSIKLIDSIHPLKIP